MNVEIICNTIVKVIAMVLLFLFGIFFVSTVFVKEEYIVYEDEEDKFQSDSGGSGES